MPRRTHPDRDRAKRRGWFVVNSWRGRNRDTASTLACESGKRRFRDQSEATASMHRLNAPTRRRQRVIARVYECPMCNGWHFTSWETPNGAE